MTDAITIVDNSATVIAELQRIGQQIDKMRPVYQGIGELLVDSTKNRFDTSTAPDGSRWAPNAAATVLGHLANISGSFSKKTGRLTKKGAKAVMAKKPLIESGLLQDSFAAEATDSGVAIGTNRFAGDWDAGAAVHQFGSKDGTIPARPFLGLSAQDEINVLELLAESLRSTTSIE